MILNCRGKKYNLDKRTLIMGILNVTPDSFSDGGMYFSYEKAVEHGLRMAKEGADIIDVGGESTRPGSDPITIKEEIDRILPVIQILLKELNVPISVDTYKSKIASLCLQEGVHMVNDISGLSFDEKMVDTIVQYNVPVIIMHIKGTPKNMQINPHYHNFLKELKGYFKERIHYALSKGISEENIIIDPGIGFGKRLNDNFSILHNIAYFKKLGFPVVIGASRKSFIGKVLEADAHQRLEGSLAAAAISCYNGAHIIRVHDVKETMRTLTIIENIKRANNGRTL